MRVEINIIARVANPKQIILHHQGDDDDLSSSEFGIPTNLPAGEYPDLLNRLMEWIKKRFKKEVDEALNFPNYEGD